MEKRTESRRIEVKVGKTWTQSCGEENTNREYIYDMLSHELLAKWKHKCSYITSIREHTNYDGTRTVVVTYDNDCRAVYIINE